MQSASRMHSTQEPGDPAQNRCLPVPEHGADAPHWQLRSPHVFASVGLQGTPHPVHSVALTAEHAATPLCSQQSSLLLQPLEFEGSQAPHCPFWVPLRTQAVAPPGFAAQRSSALEDMEAVSHATHALPTHRGFFELPVQSLSEPHSTHLPLPVSQTGVAVRFEHWSFDVHA